MERLSTGNTKGISVKSPLEEDGLKLSAGSFLNGKSFSCCGVQGSSAAQATFISSLYSSSDESPVAFRHTSIYIVSSKLQ